MTRQLILALILAFSGVSCSTWKKSSEPVSSQAKPRMPSLKGAEVKTIWIPDKIEGSRYEEGHYLHLIDKQSSWSLQ